MPPVPDGSLSRVVLFGTSRYSDPDLHDLPSVTHNLDALQQTLTHPDWWGVPAENCVRVDDRNGPVTVRELRGTLREAAEHAQDLLLVYYAGHGLPLEPGDLVLAVTNTERHTPRASGLPIDDIRDTFLDCRARTRILVLDCCFSGRALEHLGLDKATATLASVSATEPGDAPENAEFTEFGGHLVRILRGGVAGGERTLSLRVIADAIRTMPGGARLARLQASQGAADVPLVRNPAWRCEAPDPLTATELTKLAYVVQGVDEVAARISRTLGPRGRANLITLPGGDVQEFDAAVTVAANYRPVGQPDEVGRGVQLVHDLVAAVYRHAGDGSATAVVIARALIDGVFGAIRRDENPGQLMEGISEAFSWAIRTLQAWAEPIDSREKLISITRSSARDQAIGELVADAVNRAGDSGTVLVEYGHTHENSLDFVPGLRVDSGCASPDLYTDPMRDEVVLEQPFVVVSEERLTIDRVRTVVDQAAQAQRPPVIFAGSVDGDALADAVAARDERGLLVVELPDGDAADAIKALLRTTGRRGLGTPRLVWATRNRTLLIWTADAGQDVAPSIHCPIVRVGADRDTSPQARLRLTRSAVSSAFAALDGGTVAGGGIALRDVARQLRRLIELPAARRPEGLGALRDAGLAGVRIAADALIAPACAMAENARLDAVELRSLLDAAAGVGVDLAAAKIDSTRKTDMVGDGIIDAVTMVRTVLECALHSTRQFVRLA